MAANDLVRLPRVGGVILLLSMKLKYPIGYNMQTIIRICIISGIFLFTSCAASWHIRQACKKEPELCKVNQPDTVTLNVPVIVQKIDTLFKTDTAIVYKSKDSVILRIVYRAGRVDTVEAQCPPKQIITVDRPVYVPVPPTAREKWAIRWKWTGIVALSALGLYIGILGLK